MSLFPVPDLMAPDIYAVEPRELKARGVRFLLLDIDNTIAPYTVHAASERMKDWVCGMRAAGLELFILSNNRGTRPETFAAAFGLPYRKKAWKPFPKIARAVMAERGYSPAETAFLGDQIYTDVCCAKWCGALAVLVRPIELTRILLRIRYWLEAPFRLAYQIKKRRK